MKTLLFVALLLLVGCPSGSDDGARTAADGGTAGMGGAQEGPPWCCFHHGTECECYGDVTQAECDNGPNLLGTFSEYVDDITPGCSVATEQQ